VEITVEGTTSPITGEIEVTDLELAVGMKRTSRSDFCKPVGGGKFTLTFPNPESYSEFLSEIRTSSANPALIAGIMDRHSRAQH
jgi:hypothetical protein